MKARDVVLRQSNVRFVDLMVFATIFLIDIGLGGYGGAGAMNDISNMRYGLRQA